MTRCCNFDRPFRVNEVKESKMSGAGNYTKHMLKDLKVIIEYQSKL